MKKNIFIITLTTVVFSFLFNSCESYLDVENKGIIDETDLFVNFNGFRDAMFGAYASITENNLYGQNLSYGFLDELAQLYIFERENVNVFLDKAIFYQYNEPEIEQVINNIWANSYESISYVNNVIDQLKNVDLNSDSGYSLIKGEAHALRAFLHFDLTRMFCETLSMNPSATGIPYSDSFDLELPRLYDLNTIYNLIIDDLNIAEESLINDTELIDEESTNIYIKNRAIHLNKYAVWALKARIYLWKGDYENARIYAESVINSNKFMLYDKITLPDNMKYPATSETIWAVSNTTKYNDIFNKFLFEDISNRNYQYVAPNVDDLYESSSFTADNTDVRLDNYFIENNNNRTLFRRLLDLPVITPDNLGEDRDEINGFTMMRLPEMYYIAAEAYYDIDVNKAKRYFNDVRNSRGLLDIDDSRVDTKEKFLNELLLEKKKELWGEGQIFLEYKRLNKDISNKDGDIFNASNDIFVFPLPDDEVEFGN